MELNTCVITLEERDRLKAVEKAVLDEKQVFVRGIWGGFYVQSKDKTIKEITSLNESLSKKNLELEQQISSLEKEKKKKMDINSLKQMSWRQFRKWKKE